MSSAKQVKLLTGGNPQIAKGDGPAVVAEYIAAMPGWKQQAGLALDALIRREVPNVVQAVKWNSSFYGTNDDGWFLSFHCCTKYVKVAFFRGASLLPLPPVVSKQAEVRYLHLFEGDAVDTPEIATWVRQASALPGWKP